MDEGKQVEERYLGAASSSHLRLRFECPGDVDLLVASGWARETMATELYRLRGEFDAAKGNMRQHQLRTHELQGQAAELRELALAQRAKAKFGPTRAGLYEQQAAAVLRQLAEEAVTARALILMQLKSLDRVTRALRHFSEQHAARKGFAGVDVYRVAGRALDAMLDPLCPVCDGVGFLGGFGKRKVLCGGDHGCRGSGKRRVDFGSVEAHAFGQLLLAEMERKFARVDALMLSFIRRVRTGESVPLDSSLVSAPMIELQRRLADLRSAQANQN